MVRRNREYTGTAVQLNTRVDVAQRVKAQRAAAALGISVNAYIEQLLAREELDADGRPLWWTDPVPADQTALPLRIEGEAALKSA